MNEEFQKPHKKKTLSQQEKLLKLQNLLKQLENKKKSSYKTDNT
jgi:hypothetical protein